MSNQNKLLIFRSSYDPFNGRIATEYLNLPKCSPDFIYLDAPDQFKIKKV